MSWWQRLAARRAPDLVIGRGSPYLNRWFLRRASSRSFNVFLHQYMRSDDDRHLHDHPWPSISYTLAGHYIELEPDYATIPFRCGPGSRERTIAETIAGANRRFSIRRKGEVIRRAQHDAHAILIPTHLRGQVWTLFVTGRNRNVGWGFYTKDGFVPEGQYEHYLDELEAHAQTEPA